MLHPLRQIAANLGGELQAYRAVTRHPRTPWLANWCLGAAIAYALLPFDLIPDFIPVLGHVDDLIVIPALVAAGLCLVPSDVVSECRNAVTRARHDCQTE